MVSDDDPPHRERSATIPPAVGDRSTAVERTPGGNGDPDELPETIRHRLERLVPELVKKTFAAGLGAVFSTEEGIRKIARESLPEVAGYIASSADGAKDKVFEVIARETRDFLATLNVSEEIAKILTTLSFEIKTEIRFIPNSDRFVGAEPDVKASVRLKRQDERKDGKDGRDDRKDDKKDDEREGRSRLRFWHRDKDGDGGEPEREPGAPDSGRDRKP
ncbi:MAG TPA: hypothetical protein VIX73_20745 [Kofleriaceae bacterium]|jgi:hypothetical protein